MNVIDVIYSLEGAPQWFGFIDDKAIKNFLITYGKTNNRIGLCLSYKDLDFANKLIDQCNLPPSYVFIEWRAEPESETKIKALIENLKDVKLVLIGTKNEVNLYKKFMAWGVTDYLLMPLTIDMMDEIYKDKAQQENKINIGFLSSRIGCGATTFAINYCLALNRHHNQKSILLDFDINFGDLASKLDLMASPGLHGALIDSDRMDLDYIKNLWQKKYDELFVITNQWFQKQNFSEINFCDDKLNILISLLQSEFNIIGFDLSPPLNSHVNTFILSRLKELFVITDLSISSVRDTIVMVNEFKLQFPNLIIHLIANQRQPIDELDMILDTLSNSTELEVSMVLPFCKKELFSAELEGDALLHVAGNEKYSKKIIKYAAQLNNKTLTTYENIWQKIKKSFSGG